MYTRQLPSPELLRKLLRYEPLTGLLFWRERPIEMFTDGKQTAKHNCNAWNAKNANNEAFTSVAVDGYKVGRIFGKNHRAHRVIWAMVTGAWPVDQIDHEDHDKINNRFVNLCEATNGENGKNASMKSNNTSGFTGVHWSKQAAKWQASIGVDNEQIHLGFFTRKSDAIAARQGANIKYNFHENHGV